jgi:hypothetical protein
MRAHRSPLSFLFDEGVRENDRGGKRLAFEISDLRGSANYNRRITIKAHVPV